MLIWLWFRGEKRKSKAIKVEILLIPIVIVIALPIDTQLFFHLEKHVEPSIQYPVWKNSIAVLPFTKTTGS